jgi:hypothetical protein
LKFDLYIAPQYSDFKKKFHYVDSEYFMSIISIASPLQAVLGFSLLATVAIVFKPLLTGVFRALKMAIKPSLNKEQRLARAYYRNAMTLHAMSSSNEALSPNLAAELRALSGRN